MRNATKEIEYCIELMSALYELPPNYTYKVNGRLKKSYGRCLTWTKSNDPTYFKAELLFNRVIFDEEFPIDYMYNTILHELCHLVDRNENGHDGRWLKIAEEVSDCYGFIDPIKQYATTEESIYFNELNPKNVYQCKCEKCGHVFTRKGYRAPKWYMHPYDHTHTGCGGHLMRV